MRISKQAFSTMGTERFFETPPIVPPSLPENLEGTIDKLAEKCCTYNERDRHLRGSIYTGALGVCGYLHFKLAQYYNDRSEAVESDGEACQYRSKATHMLLSGLKTCEAVYHHPSNVRSARCTLLESPKVGSLALQSAILHRLGKEEQAVEVGRHLEAMGSRLGYILESEECEVLYGRAGYLHSILFLRKHLHRPEFCGALVKNLVRHILSVGEATARQSLSGLPLMWVWHGTEYLGAAHGVVGILFALLMCESEVRALSQEENRDYMKLIQKAIDGLGTKQCFESGNLKSSVGKEQDRLVQWCHGAPGHVMLLAKASQVYEEPEYLNNAKKICRDVVLTRGLLRKGVGLCHGIGGNAYCFLSVYRALPEGSSDREEWLEMAKHFAKFGLEHLAELETLPDRPYSLFEGLAGFVALLVDLQNPEKSGFPCYEYF